MLQIIQVAIISHKMKILTLSDTHNQHKNIPSEVISNLDGNIDMILHAGDMTSSGSKFECTEFFNWFSQLPFRYKVVIAGNHDFFFDDAPDEDIQEFLSNYPDVIYLNDSGVEIEGLKIWGSPITPYFFNWAFNRIGDTIKTHWDLIPLDTDILVTHGPVYGYLDMTQDKRNVGCTYLRDKIQEMSNLKLYVCGHIHEDYGMIDTRPGPIFVNASVLNLNYRMTRLPILIEIE